jgi:hypothetical protein
VGAEAESYGSKMASIGLNSLAASKALLSSQRSNSEHRSPSRNAMLKRAHLPDLLLEQPSFRVRQEGRGHGTTAGHGASGAVERNAELCIRHFDLVERVKREGRMSVQEFCYALLSPLTVRNSWIARSRGAGGAILIATLVLVRTNAIIDASS